MVDNNEYNPEHILSKKIQESLTPNQVIQSLKEGNSNYINDDLTERDHIERIKKTSKTQYPKAIILACVDSRVPVEKLFDKGIGDIFVVRIAGNFVNEDILGSMEFACKVSGSKLIVVLGHENCSALKAAVNKVRMGNITTMLSKIQPVIDQLNYKGDTSINNPEYMSLLCKTNVLNTIKDIRLKSPILKEMEQNGEIKIVGSVYDVDNGKVDFFD